MQIVIAWADKTGMKPTGQNVLHNGILQPEFTFAWEGKAAIWLLDGTRKDLARAKAYATTEEGYQVFTYPPTEQEPLVRARARAKQSAEKSERNR